jgi:phosphoserine aminotransferase
MTLPQTKGANIMAAKLVIIKQKRETADVEFFATSAEQKAALAALTDVKAVAGERNFKGGLIKIRTLFFPTVELFDAWTVNETVAGVRAQRVAYNAANGITESERVIDMPNLVV